MNLRELHNKAKTLSEQINELRENLDDVQSEIAKKLGVDHSIYLAENLISVDFPLQGSTKFAFTGNNGVDYTQYKKEIEGIEFVHFKRNDAE